MNSNDGQQIEPFSLEELLKAFQEKTGESLSNKQQNAPLMGMVGLNSSSGISVQYVGNKDGQDGLLVSEAWVIADNFEGGTPRGVFYDLAKRMAEESNINNVKYPMIEFDALPNYRCVFSLHLDLANNENPHEEVCSAISRMLAVRTAYNSCVVDAYKVQFTK